MINNKNMIPKGTTDFYGREAKLRDYVLGKIELIYKKYGFESLYTPILENAEVFKGHHGDGEKLLFTLKDKNGEEYVLKYDSTVPLARVISMYDDIKLPYKRYQLQQSYRDDEIDKGHYREFIQCDGDVIGSRDLITDSEFVMISYEGLRAMGFNDFTIRLNHRKLIKAIAEKTDVHDQEGLLSIQRAIDVADKINKGSINDVKAELAKTGISENVIDVIVDLIKISEQSKTIEQTLNNIGNYFGDVTDAREGIAELKEIISYLPQEVQQKVKIDFTLARGADYYTGFIIEAIINNIHLGAVLGGGRYDNLLEAFGKESVPAVGLAFGMERIIVAMKEIGLDKRICNSLEPKVLIYTDEEAKIQALKVATMLREKQAVSIVSNQEVSLDELQSYCEQTDVTLVATIDKDANYKLYNKGEFDILKSDILQKQKVKKIGSLNN